MTEQKTIDNQPLHLNEHNKKIQGEINLWRAVIAKALDDLCLPPSNKRYRIWQRQAIRWFNQDNEDFIAICDYANLSAQQILKIAQQIMRLP